jgi:hypothetical protein
MLLFDCTAAPDHITWGIRRATTFASCVGLHLEVVTDAVVDEAHPTASSSIPTRSTIQTTW